MMCLNKKIIVILALISVLHAHGQTLHEIEARIDHLPTLHSIDSLKQLLTQPLPDTTRVDVLLSLSARYRSRNMKSALDYCEQAIEVCSRVKHPVLLAIAYEAYGTLFNLQGNYAKASRYFHKALDTLITDQSIRARGWHYYLLHNSGGWMTPLTFPERIKHLRNAFSCGEKANDPQLLGFCSSQLGNHYGGIYADTHEKKFLDSAYYFWEKQGEYFSRIKFEDGLARAVGAKGIGLFYEDINRAEPYFRRSLKMNFDNGNLTGIANNLGNLGEILTERRQYDSAISYYELARILMIRSTFFVGEGRMVDGLVKNYELKGDFKNAFQIQKHFHQRRDSVYSMRHLGEVLEVREDYERKLREQELNETLAFAKYNELQVRQRELMLWAALCVLLGAALFGYFYFRNRNKLIDALKKNQVLDEQIKHNLQDKVVDTELIALRAQMNPHFIFNSLNAIQNLIFKEDKTQAISYLNAFAQLSRRALENSSRDQITLSEEIAFLKTYLELERLRHDFNFNYNIHVDDDLDIGHEQLPPMIIQPYVENAIRHGLSSTKEGVLNISFQLDTHDNGIMVVKVEDNGIGRAEAERKKVKYNSHRSFASDATASRIKLMQEYSDAYRVEIIDKYDDEKPTGTLVVIQLPLINAMS